VAKVFTQPGTYSAMLTVTDDRGATASASVLVNVTEVKSTRLRVASIGLAQVKSGTKSLGRASVLVTDTAGKPVSGVKVSFRWSGVVSGTGSVLTDASGAITATSKAFSNGGTLTFTVSGLSKSGYTYTSADNAVTKVSISASRTGR
jgi:PKD repeat protein